MAKINYDGTNIVGAPYKPYVDGQIKIRQEKLGKLNKNNEDIAWENAKSAYVALASSINIQNSTYTKETTVYGGPSVHSQNGEDTTGAASGMQGSTQSPSGQEQRANEALLYNESGEIILDSTIEEGIFGFDTTIETIQRNDGEQRAKLLELPGDPQDYFGNRLARETVLYGGTAYYPEITSAYTNPEYRFGITNNINVLNNSAYGYGGTEEGIKPMPGITAFDIKSKNMGSLKEASITIRANNREQFKMIDNLYCRIGYTMFIEWGNTLYFDNEGKYQSHDSTPLTLIPTFLSGKIKFKGREQIDLTKNPTQFLQLIENWKESSNGNYDAFFGRVKNFSWEYIAKGQYYEINLSLISWGDIIESLTVDAQWGLPTGKSDVETAENTSALSTFLSEAATPKGKIQTFENGDGEVFEVQFTGNTDDKIIHKTYLSNASERTYKNWFWGNTDTLDGTDYSDTIPSLGYTRLASSVGKIVSNYAQYGNKNYYYVRFGDILDFIKDQLLLYAPEGSNEAIMDIDTDTNKNICYWSGINISADPTKVMVRASLPYNPDELRAMVDDNEDEWPHKIRTNAIFSYDECQLEFFGSTLDPNDPSKGDFPLHGKIMNIYFEFGYLMETIKGLRDEKSTKIPLFDFLSQLCDTANSCLGGVNKLSIRLENDRLIRIYDQNPIYGTQALEGEATALNLTGIKPTLAFDEPGEFINHGSFVTDVSVKTQLTNDFSTTVSVGAQAQDQVVGEDATGLSSWNYGLIDRYYPKKIDSLQKNKKSTEAPTSAERVQKIRQQLKFLWLGYAEAVVRPENLIPLTSKEAYREDTVVKNTALGQDPRQPYYTRTQVNKLVMYNFPIDKVSDFTKLQQDWLSEIIKQENTERNALSLSKSGNSYGTNQIGMIPINVQITMDGLSGIRIYDKLTIDSRFLPKYYPQTLYWIIKGVSHEIQNNKWYTKLETIAVPKIHEEQDLKAFVRSEGLPVNTEDFSREFVGGAPQFGSSGITYTIPELTPTSQPYDNTPTPTALAALQLLDANILQPITSEFGKIGITSGYRSPAVNKAIGGATKSQHMRGEAVDFTRVASGRPLSEVFTWAATNLDFDQIIWEKGNDGNPRWIHISYNSNPKKSNRNKLLRFFGNNRYVDCNEYGEI